jgi:hypothetical protein
MNNPFEHLESEENNEERTEEEETEKGTEEAKEERMKEGTEERTDPQEDVIQKELQEYKEFIENSKSRLEPFLKERYLSQQFIIILFDILNDGYGFINYVQQNYNDLEEIQKWVYEMVDQLDYFYHKMNRFQEFLCSEDGFNAIREYGDLEDIDFYYNMAIVNKCVDYLYVSLECSTDSFLNQVDKIYSQEINRKKRYLTYFDLLFFVFRKKPLLFDTKNKNNLYRICQNDPKLLKEFKELTRKLRG